MLTSTSGTAKTEALKSTKDQTTERVLHRCSLLPEERQKPWLSTPSRTKRQNMSSRDIHLYHQKNGRNSPSAIPVHWGQRSVAAETEVEKAATFIIVTGLIGSERRADECANYCLLNLPAIKRCLSLGRCQSLLVRLCGLFYEYVKSFSTQTSHPRE